MRGRIKELLNLNNNLLLVILQGLGNNSINGLY